MTSWGSGSDRTKPGEAAGTDAPQSCPFCTSAAIVSTAKVPDASSYWRCSKCGEVWNPARQATHAVQNWRR
jgi:predicted Zn finger-like uncharacterized protein